MKEKDSTAIRSAVINKAINYIFDHIEEDITVDDVALHCAYSKYHLMRMFKEDMDEALYQFIKRVRLERSAWRLKVEKEKSITEIGGEYGYSSSNFSTAFKKQLNVSPADFRKVSEQMVEESSFSNGITLNDFESYEQQILNLKNNLDALDPKSIMKRGYSAVTDDKGNFVNSVNSLKPDDKVIIYMQDGSADCTVAQVRGD